MGSQAEGFLKLDLRLGLMPVCGEQAAQIVAGLGKIGL